MKIGYARVSTGDQNLDLQLDALRKAGCEKLFTDTMSGAFLDRPGLEQALAFLRQGDTLVVWRLDRLGRSLGALVSLVTGFKDKGINFVSLTEQLDTTSPTGVLIFNIFASFAQYEREQLIERTQAGLAAARARGRNGGRPGITQQKIDAIKALVAQQIETKEICTILGIGRTSVYKYSKASPAPLTNQDGRGLE